jgi:hypothetical protein
MDWLGSNFLTNNTVVLWDLLQPEIHSYSYRTVFTVANTIDV